MSNFDSQKSNGEVECQETSPQDMVKEPLVVKKSSGRRVSYHSSTFKQKQIARVSRRRSSMSDITTVKSKDEKEPTASSVDTAGGILIDPVGTLPPPPQNPPPPLPPKN